MKINIKYTPTDIYEANKLHYFSSRYQYIFYAIALYAIGVVLLSGVYDWASFLPLICAIFLLSYPWVFLRLYAPYSLKKSRGLQSEVSFEFDETGITTNSPLSTGKMDWKVYNKQRSNNKVLLLFLNQNAFHLIPRRVLSEEGWNQLLKLAKEKILSHS